MKRTLTLVFSVLLLCITVITVSANAPPPPLPSFFDCTVQNAPADAVYFDILIEITPQDEDYKASDNNTKPVDSKIVQYNQDGYMSLTFHYKKLDYADNRIEYASFKMKDFDLSINKVSPTIKAVILDKDGNILQISPSISTAPKTAEEFTYRLIYDAADMTSALNFYSEKTTPSFINPLLLLHPLYALSILLPIFIRMALSVGIETLIAIPFKLRPLWKVSLVNLLTQIILIVFMRCSDIPYLTALIIGEAYVYISEFVAYSYLYKIPKWKLAIYTVVANTFTLALGLLMNAYTIFI